MHKLGNSVTDLNTRQYSVVLYSYVWVILRAVTLTQW